MTEFFFDPQKNYGYDELYGPVKAIREKDAAIGYFKKLVTYDMKRNNLPEPEAVARMKKNVAYYAGYSGQEVRERVEELFECEHPILGSVKEMGYPTAREAVELGKALANGETITLKKLRELKGLRRKR